MTARRSLPTVVACFGLVGAIVAGCGEDRNAASTSGTGAETNTQTIKKGPVVGTVALTETQFKITPVEPTAKKAGLIEFRVHNNGTVVHALEVEGPNGEQRTGNIQPGKSATLKVDLGKAGTYDMYCPIDNHKGKGLEGAVRVAGGGFGAAKHSPTDKQQSPSGGSSGY